MAVPFFDYVEERWLFNNWTIKKGKEGLSKTPKKYKDSSTGKCTLVKFKHWNEQR